jgi:predicted O-methyltransferase YrrM
MEFVRMLNTLGINGRCLQLGLGVPGASHYVFSKLFNETYTIEINQSTVNDYCARLDGQRWFVVGDTHNKAIFSHFPKGSFDLLFIDAGHKYSDVAFDFNDYAPLVRKGGIIAFHDSLKRPTYEDEIEVWKFLDYLKSLHYTVHTIGEEIGIAYLIKE